MRTAGCLVKHVEVHLTLTLTLTLTLAPVAPDPNPTVIRTLALTLAQS